jgi:hypothetical protein
MLLTEVQLGAVVEVDEKHAKKIARMFNDFLDGLPSRIANTTVLQRESKGVKEKPNGEQVPRAGGRHRKGTDGV